MEKPRSQPRKPPLRKAFGRDLPPVEILDIGAMTEGEDRYAGLLAQELAQVIGFEPNLVQFEKLRQQALPGKQYLPLCLGRGGTVPFYLTRYPGCSSLYEPDPAVIDLFMTMNASDDGGNFHVIRVVPMETQRLDEVPGLPPCDFLKIDVQGAELDVLAGGSGVLSNVTVLEAEVEFVPLYKNQPLFGDVQSYLHQRGFLLHKLIDVTGRTFRPVQFGDNPYEPISQLLWADAIFVRDFSQLSTWSEDQLLKAAMVLYDTYCSHDLAHRLLSEWDRRRGTHVAAHLAQNLQSLDRIPWQFLTLKANI